MNGSELVGQRYQPPFDHYREEWGAKTSELESGEAEPILWRVVSADFVTTDSGTGIVHQAPAFGEIDHEVLLTERKRFKDKGVIPLLCAVDPNGQFNDAAGSQYAGRWVKDCDKELARELREKGLLVHQEMYRHDYPFCPRAPKDALIQYPRHSWFIRTTEFVDDMLANNQKITFCRSISGRPIWEISRVHGLDPLANGFGVPLPIWSVLNPAKWKDRKL